MKKTLMTAFLAVTLVLVSGIAISATITTNGTGGGVWSATATWSGGVVPAVTDSIVIASTDSVIFDQSVTIAGVINNLSAHKDSIVSGVIITFGNGGKYYHGADGGTIPVATWSTGSTCIITGVVTSVPSNSNQNFYNLTWNCVQTAGLNLGWSNVTIGGNVNILNTGGIASANQLALSSATYGTTAAAPNVLTINGNLNISGSTTYFAGISRSSGVSYGTLIVKGNVTTDASAYIALGKGSGATSAWWLYGNVTLGGTFNYGNTKTDTIEFLGNGTYTTTYTLTPYTYLVVGKGATVKLASSDAITTSATSSFIVSSGATLGCSNASGLSANIPTATYATLSTGARYLFNAGTAQISSALLPTTVQDLIVDKSTLTLTNTTAITDTLYLLNGGTIVGTNYTATHTTVTAVEKVSNVNPTSYKVYANYPNPFNPSTLIKYDLPKASFVTLKVYNLLGQEVATLVNASQSVGQYTATFNGSNLSSGMYIYRIQAGSFSQVRRMMLVK